MIRIIYLLSIPFILLSCQANPGSAENQSISSQESIQDFSGLDTATFAGGCFWCIEASFDQIKGVKEAVSGYAGGEAGKANYDLVSSGKTNHAETVQIYFDPQVIDYETLLDIFFTAHDPTQVNRQGPDIGFQYRTAIFCHSDQQKELAKLKINALQPRYDKPIATELNQYEAFYKAEEYHQDYEEKHPYNPYIQNVSKPKIDRVKKKFADRLKDKEG